jgi:stage II sporulation protein M
MLDGVLKWYKGMWDYIWDSRVFVLVALAIFLASVLLGSLITVIAPSVSDSFIQAYQNSSSTVGDPSNPDVGLLWGIFSRNALLEGLSIYTGPVLGLLPMFMAFANGLLFGVVVMAVTLKAGVLPVVVSLAPHGIIELPTMFLAMGMGLRLAWDLVMKAIDRPRRMSYLRELALSSEVYFTVVLPLCVLAAVVETYVTTYLIGFIR